MGSTNRRMEQLERRHARVRKQISGTGERPRLCVYKSLRYIYAQVIDDVRGHTLAAASSREASLGQGAESTKGVDAAKAVGAAIAERAKALGVESVVFDRSGYPYHGRVKALADAAREGGLQF